MNKQYEQDPLGNRMKLYYESRSETRLIRRMPVIIRLDGRGFHSTVRKFKRPFDEVLITTMQKSMQYLCQNIQGCVLGYSQSDEISLLLVDYHTLAQESWYDYRVQKMTSVAASMLTFAFSKYLRETIEDYKQSKDREEEMIPIYERVLERGAFFDCRVWNLPKEEVTNYFLWRQKDCTKNSIHMVARSLFSHNSLQDLTAKEMQEKMMQEKNVNYNTYPVHQRRGTFCKKNEEKRKVGEPAWMIDKNAPILKEAGRNYVEKLVYVGEEKSWTD